MKITRILYFTAHPEGMGGAVKVLLKEAIIMQSMGHIVRIVLQNDDNGYHNPIYDEFCNEVQLDYISIKFPVSTCMEEINYFDSESAYQILSKIIEKFKPDMLHSVQLNIAAELASRKLHIPHLMNIYPVSDDMFNIKWMNIYPEYQSADSLFYCKKWSKGLNIESECIRVPYKRVECGNEDTDLELFESSEVHEYEMVCIALFTPYKRQLEILMAIKQCREKEMDVHITFLGNNKTLYGDECEQYVKVNNLEKYVSILGFVSNVEPYLKKADALIVASTSESYPGVIVEAMANRVAVISTPVAGIPELVIDRVNGVLSDGYDYFSLLSAIQKYIDLKKSDKINQILDNAYKTYLKNHSYERVGRKLEHYYNRIIECQRTKKNDDRNSNEVEIQQIHMFQDECLRHDISEFTKKHIWFLYHIAGLHVKGKTVLVWGAGKMGRVALEWVKCLGLDMKGYIDGNKRGEYLKYAICSPEDGLAFDVDIVLVAMADFYSIEEVSAIIEKTGRRRNVDYFLMRNHPCLKSLASENDG